MSEMETVEFQVSVPVSKVLLMGGDFDRLAVARATANLAYDAIQDQVENWVDNEKGYGGSE